MGALFFQNGVSIGSDAGWCGYTGSNNYVVRYDFVTGAEGASQVSIALNGIYYGNGAGTQPFGFKISAAATAYSNARATSPDSAPGYMGYSSSAGYSCYLTAQGLNLKPYSRYYIFVYLAGSGTEYYSGWNCVAPQILCSGSYVSPVGGISSISAEVSTLSPLSLIMERPGTNFHRATFSYAGETLALSPVFESSLSYICPRDWMSRNINALSMEIDVSVQSYTDSTCTKANGQPQTARFVLSADSAMRPVPQEGAVTMHIMQPAGAESFEELISGISRVGVSFDASKLDMSACAGAGIVRYRLSYADVRAEGEEAELESGVIHGETELKCSFIDSRGREGSVILALSPLPYVPPALISLDAQRCDAQGRAQNDGAYCRVKGSAVFSELGGRNSCTVSACIRPTGGVWGQESSLPGFESGVWSELWASPTLLGGALSGDSYSLRLTITDSLGSSSQYMLRLYHQQWAMKFNSRGTALGLGMAPTVENALQLPDSWRLYAGMLVLSERSYGSLPPAEALGEAVEGQLYFQLTE